jgi:transcriptional regulator with XRE-family HTH domain
MQHCIEVKCPDRLRRLIDARGLRYSWVARRAGVSPALLSMVMSGRRRMTDALAERLADVLAVPVEVLREEEREDAA